MVEVNVDIDAFRERTADDKKLAQELFDCFLNDLPEYRNNLIMTAEKEDEVELRAILHKLKGCVGIFGFDGLSEYIRTLEFADKEDMKAKISDLLLAIDEHTKELNELMSKY